jgi:hypothetical protein
MTGGLPPISSSWRQAPWDSRPVILFSNWTPAGIVLMYHPLWQEDGCRLQLLRSSPAQSFSSLLSLRFETPPTWRARFPRNRAARLYSQAMGTLFTASYDSQSYGGGIRPRLHMGWELIVYFPFNIYWVHTTCPTVLLLHLYSLPRERV